MGPEDSNIGYLDPLSMTGASLCSKRLGPRRAAAKRSSERLGLVYTQDWGPNVAASWEFLGKPSVPLKGLRQRGYRYRYRYR